MIRAGGLFSLDADLMVDAAMRWLEDRRMEVLPPIVPYIRPTGKRAFSPDVCASLRRMAKHSGWQEIGGRGTGAGNYALERLGVKSAAEMNAAGLGRTQWIGQPEWAKGFGMSPDEISVAVEKAIAGARLGDKQRLIVQAMLEAYAESKT